MKQSSDLLGGKVKKVLICEASGFENMDTGGQPVKTRQF